MKRIKVRGHFRLVPTDETYIDKQTGMIITKMKKIWIEPYEKLVK